MQPSAICHGEVDFSYMYLEESLMGPVYSTLGVFQSDISRMSKIMYANPRAIRSHKHVTGARLL